MISPFERRVAEHVPESTFLAHIAPVPIELYLTKHAENLFNRLAIVSAPPGSGKTTIARLFEFPMLKQLADDTKQGGRDYHKLLTTLQSCGAINNNNNIMVVGSRIAMDEDYRELALCNYSDELHADLLIGLTHARALLGWCSNLRKANIAIEDVRVIAANGKGQLLEQCGGPSLDGLENAASKIEAEIYGVTTEFVPPSEADLRTSLKKRYSPLQSIEALEFGGQRMTPLLMMDDFHSLSEFQRERLLRYFVRRSIPCARWVLTRVEALTPRQALLGDAVRIGNPEDDRDSVGHDPVREITDIRLEAGSNKRGAKRKQFRTIAKDMTERYLSQMPVFAHQGIRQIHTRLAPHGEKLAPSKMRELIDLPGVVARKLGLTISMVSKLEQMVDEYLSCHTPKQRALLRPTMVTILLYREVGRQRQQSLFGQDDELYVPEAKPNEKLEQGAVMHLWYKFKVPYLAGFDQLCDLAGENAETYLRLAGQMVKQLETQLVRQVDRPNLSAELQQRVLQKYASQRIDQWGFPESTRTRVLVAGIARECLRESKLPNAPLGAGPNAFGILQEHFNDVPDKHSDLAKTLRFAIAYNAISITNNYSCQGKYWSLIELGGLACAKFELTTRRGGFLRRSVTDLEKILSGIAQ